MEDGNISIAGLDKAAVLAALYNSARTQGMGFMHYSPEPMELEEARELLAARSYFDYVKGRVMKVKIDGDSLNSRLYDRDNGEGRAAEIIAGLRVESKAA